MMADVIRQVEYFYVQVPHKAGEAARALRALKEAGVNLLAFSGFPEGRRAQMDFHPGRRGGLQERRQGEQVEVGRGRSTAF
jgi:hypothetical protein